MVEGLEDSSSSGILGEIEGVVKDRRKGVRVRKERCCRVRKNKCYRRLRKMVGSDHNS